MTYVQRPRELGNSAAPRKVFPQGVHADDDSVPIKQLQANLSPFVCRGVNNCGMEGKLSNAGTFGDRMLSARLRRHLTQEQVAEFVGLSTHMSVAHWESGANFPGLDTLVQVAGLYGVSIDWLVWGDTMAGGIDGRVRKIPEVLRAGLLDRLHKEVDETERLVERLPKELVGGHVKDNDSRLKAWSAANLRRKVAQAPNAKPGRRHSN